MPENHRHGPQDEPTACSPCVSRSLLVVVDNRTLASPADSLGRMHKDHLVRPRVQEGHRDVKDRKACVHAQKSCSAHRNHLPEDQQCGRALCHVVSGAVSELLRHEEAPAKREVLLVHCPAALHVSLLQAVGDFLHDSMPAWTVEIRLPSYPDVLWVQ